MRLGYAQRVTRAAETILKRLRQGQFKTRRQVAEAFGAEIENDSP
jgi:hypothetical protein